MNTKQSVLDEYFSNSMAVINRMESFITTVKAKPVLQNTDKNPAVSVTTALNHKEKAV